MINLNISYLSYKLDLIQTLILKSADIEYKKKFGMRTKYLRIIRVIHLFDGIAAKELSDMLLLDKTLLSKILNDFESKNLIHRKINKKDSRVQNIYLTEKGIKMYENSVKVGMDLEQKMFSSFCGEKWKCLHDMLDNVVESLNVYNSKIPQTIKFKPLKKNK